MKRFPLVLSNRSVCFFWIIGLVMTKTGCMGFTTTTSTTTTTSSLSTGRFTRSSCLSSLVCLSASFGSNNDAAAQFEYQELKIQLDAMKRANVPSNNLQPTKRQEIERYVRKVIANRPSTPAVWTPEMFTTTLPGSTWRLAFSTDSAVLGDLPRDVNVYLRFYKHPNWNTMEYTLNFGTKTFALKNIKAISKWYPDFDQTAGLVTFVYDKITTDIFGFQNVGVGFFGLLKGRANYVQTAYFDNVLWIERGFTAAAAGGQQDYLNVYVREDDKDEDDDKW